MYTKVIKYQNDFMYKKARAKKLRMVICVVSLE